MASTRDRVSVRSRFPEILAELAPRVDDALYEGAKVIAARAASHAPVGATGELQKSIEARPTDKNAAEVWAAWYWFLVEYGGAVNRPPHPFLVPAAEASRTAVEELVKAKLRAL